MNQKKTNDLARREDAREGALHSRRAQTPHAPKSRGDWLGLGALALMVAGIVAPSALTLSPAPKAFLATLPSAASTTLVAVATASLMLSAWGLGRQAAKAQKRIRQAT